MHAHTGSAALWEMLCLVGLLGRLGPVASRLQGAGARWACMDPGSNLRPGPMRSVRGLCQTMLARVTRTTRLSIAQYQPEQAHQRALSASLLQTAPQPSTAAAAQRYLLTVCGHQCAAVVQARAQQVCFANLWASLECWMSVRSSGGLARQNVDVVDASCL
jgi:hypothetical protein